LDIEFAAVLNGFLGFKLADPSGEFDLGVLEEL
jgi:hypothetical protein